ncbi:XRE family transcriptional regulator [Salmonella enterica subsp. enterica serovar Typhimurium]|nr:XRE family transcriptional regulator [Salmonella enterica]ECG1194737.1 XRE family transcriptional regulator [Salmonella bongori]ECU9569604.1 XRE family transcriptional regulator [Salmonella enterica subsp. enterica serovar Typhimurium]EDI5366502.1 XRE family transcriptional regulator [Salmonella enterica subsp. enterica serovar Senftenberg]EDV8734444.1 helix-turn-helix domain-containing protein [Salmonella enterica subsp. enterica serovar Pomona]EDW2266097.1 helix-turn-helix domain-containi
MMLFMKKRGEWLKERREELKSLDKRKYSMRAVAERVGISSAGMSHLENTDAMPSLDLAMKLAKELDRPIEWILNGTVTYGQRGIPIVGTTLTGPNSEWLDSMGRSGSYNEFVDITVPNKRLYGLKVSGDPGCGYNEGEVVVVDPDSELITGEDVVVMTHEKSGSCVKILASMRSGQYFFDSPTDRNQRLISDLDDIISIHSVIFVAKSHTIKSN